ncbi:MAG: DNA methyltransferase [Acidimicrobiales bacterium]
MASVRAPNLQLALFPVDDELPHQNNEELRHQTNFVSNMQLPVHRWFRYSAGFSAAWVEKVLRESGDPSRMTVLDPFAGSGTTLLAAQSCGAVSLGWDSHSFVARLANTKLRWQADATLLRSRASGLLRSFRPVPPSVNAAPLLARCYTPEVLADLLGLRDALLASGTDDDVGSLLWLALVAIVRPVSHVGTAQWQYVLPNKRKGRTLGVWEAFAAQIDMMATDMEWRQSECPFPATATFLEIDARSTDQVTAGWATHVICSPPYANNYDYADATRLEQTVLGEVSSWGDLKQFRNKLMRSCSQHMTNYNPHEALSDPLLDPIRDELRTVYNRLDAVRSEHGGNKAYHSMVCAYFHDLAHVWKNLRIASSPGAVACFVIGDSAPYGVHVPVERWLGELAVSVGFESWNFEKVRDRNIKWKNRKHRVPLHEGRLWVQG